VTRSDRLGLVYSLSAIWCALLLAIYLIHNGGVQGVMNANATSLGVIILLGLGTFVAGVQARVWQICAVGGILFLAVPGLGWPGPVTHAFGGCHSFHCRAWWSRMVGQPKTRLGQQESPYIRKPRTARLT